MIPSDADSNSQSAFVDQALEQSGQVQQAHETVPQQTYIGTDGYVYDASYYSQYYEGYTTGSQAQETR